MVAPAHHGEHDSDQHNQRDLDPGSGELLSVNRTKDGGSGKQRKQHAEAAGKGRKEQAAEENLLYKRSNHHAEGSHHPGIERGAYHLVNGELRRSWKPVRSKLHDNGQQHACNQEWTPLLGPAP